MKKAIKWIITLGAAALLTGLAGSALADERVYTSPSFRLPGNRIEIPAEETEAAAEDVTAEAVNETEAGIPENGQEETAAAEAEEHEEAGEAEMPEEPAGEAEETEEAAGETETPEEPAGEAEETEEAPEEAEIREEAGEVTDAAETEETTESAETTETAEEPDDYDELANEPAAGTEAWDADPEDETAPEERQVLVRSSRRETVTGGEIIELTSRLIGFGDAEVHYQWQVDRNDGAGWVNAEDGNRWKYTFLADRTTVMYNWRLIVTVDE